MLNVEPTKTGCLRTHPHSSLLLMRFEEKTRQSAETDAAGHQQIPTRRATRRAPPPGTAGGLRGLGAVSSHCRRLPIPP